MMALETPGSDPYVAALAELGRSMPRPRAICLVSAHWYACGRYVSESLRPETIYDFSGFPEELSRVRYDCPGFPEGAAMLDEVAPDLGYRAVERGIDHGGWTVLRHLYPDADVPVFSLSLDATASMADHLELGRRLGPLRDE